MEQQIEIRRFNRIGLEFYGSADDNQGHVSGKNKKQQANLFTRVFVSVGPGIRLRGNGR